jgi:MFS family permease
MWLCGGALFCLLLGLYSLFYWVPQLIQRLGQGLSVMSITGLSALPWIGNALGMLFVGWHSDRHQERYWHLAIAIACGAIGLAIAGSSNDLPVALVGLTIASLGLGGSQATFWSVPIGFLRGASNAATVFACMNFLGNLAGVFGGIVIGWLVQTTGSFRASIYALASVLIVGVAMILALERQQRR